MAPLEVSGNKSNYWEYLTNPELEYLVTPDERAVLDQYRELLSQLKDGELEQILLQQVVSLAAIFEANRDAYQLNAGVIRARENIERRLQERVLIQKFTSKLSILFQINDDVYGQAWTQELPTGTSDSGKRE